MMRRATFTAMGVVLVLSLITGCSSQPKSLKNAREYVVGTWRCKLDHDVLGEIVKTLEFNQDGTYTMTLENPDPSLEYVSSGRWEINSVEDNSEPGKPNEKTYKIVFFVSGFKNEYGELRDGQIRGAFGDFKKTR